MPLIEPGRVCFVTKGADTGKKVVIKEVVNKNFVIVSGEQVKERRSNVKHLEITSKKSKSAPKAKEVKKKEKKPQARRVKKKAEKKTKKRKKRKKGKSRKGKKAKKKAKK